MKIVNKIASAVDVLAWVIVIAIAAIMISKWVG